MERAVADDAARPVVEIEHRREAEIDAMRAEFATRACAPSRRASARGGGDIAVPQLAQRAHRRNGGEAFAKALHAAAFVIHGDQQRRIAERVDRRGQRSKLRR